MRPEEIKWALVTGASSGIGEHLSRLLAEKGINVILHGRNQVRLRALAQELSQKVSVQVVAADLADSKERQRVIEAILQFTPELVVNNAGFGSYGEALSHTLTEQTEILEVNGSALLQITLEAARVLINKKSKGVILNVASAAAFPVMPSFAVYAASKAFVVSLSQSLDEEMCSLGVRVLVACPGMVATGFRERAGGTPQGRSAMGLTMDGDFAARQIWKQIEKEKKLHVFNWIYRLMTFFVVYVLPKKWVAKSVRDTIMARQSSVSVNKDLKGKQ